MTLFFVLITVVIAAVLNGSYAFPLKHIKQWPEEALWFIFSLFAMVLLPIITTLIFVPNILNILHHIPSINYIYLIGGGIIFGIGQVCYSAAYKFIGISLNGVINISIGTSCTALIGLALSPSLIGTPYSFLQIAGILVFVAAVILGAVAGHIRTLSEHELHNDDVDSGCITLKGIRYLIIGIIFAAIAGIGVATEGVSYTIANPGVEASLKALKVTGIQSGCISWTIMYITAWIPFGLYFLILSLKRRTLKTIFTKGTGKYWLYIVIMGICYFEALVIFSKASLLIGGSMAPTVAWPLFMIFIILTVNFWGYIQGEWKNASKSAFNVLRTSIVLLIMAVIIFSLSSAFL